LINPIRESQRKYLSGLIESLKLITAKLLRKIEEFRGRFEDFSGPFIINSYVFFNREIF